MNGMRALWIELSIMNNFIFRLVGAFYIKYIVCCIIKFACLGLLLNIFYYYNFFIDLKNSMILNVESLVDFTGLHYFDVPNEIELNYFVLSYKLCLRFILKLIIKKEDLIMSLNKLFINSTWLEREVWDMFGIKFIFHSDLRRILTDYGFMGHPLLKHFPLSGFYELRFDEVFNKIIKELVELAQAFRSFVYINPWLKWHS
jgi:NADH-quinone oxidoreductase subunit C